MRSDRFIIEADHKTVGVAVRVKGGFRFVASDVGFQSLEAAVFPNVRAIDRAAAEVGRRSLAKKAGVGIPSPYRAAAEEQTYCRRRADAHLELARRAKAPFIARLHRRMARLYEQRIDPSNRASAGRPWRAGGATAHT